MPPTWHDTTAPTASQRFDYLAALFNTTSGLLNLKSRMSRLVVAHDGLSIDKESAAFRADIIRQHASFVAAFVDKGLLTRDEAAKVPEPKIVLTVHDRREPIRSRPGHARMPQS